MTRSLGVSAHALADAATRDGFELDAAQRAVIPRLLQPARHGVYLWGPVGCGKSWLVNTIVAALPTARTRRMHFHEFFMDLHRAIAAHRSSIDSALDEILHGIDTLCFDEFHVHDVGDAVFIRRMLAALFDRPVTLILTSNYHPTRLLPNPLYHEMFRPTIELLQAQMDVVELAGTRDYRLDSDHSAGFSAGAWTGPAEQPHGASPITLTVNGRPITAQRADETLLWFRFADLCDTPTASSDYLELAARHPRWAITGIPGPERLGAAAAQRFANLVDVLYDRQVPTTFVADTPLHELAAAGDAPFDLDRIMSRLSELHHRHPGSGEPA